MIWWFIHDTFMMHFRYKLWQCHIFPFIFQDKYFDFQWILLMVSLSICFIYDTFLMHSWYIHDTFIRSLNEDDSATTVHQENLLSRTIAISKSIFYGFKKTPDLMTITYVILQLKDCGGSIHSGCVLPMRLGARRGCLGMECTISQAVLQSILLVFNHTIRCKF